MWYSPFILIPQWVCRDGQRTFLEATWSVSKPITPATTSVQINLCFKTVSILIAYVVNTVRCTYTKVSRGSAWFLRVSPKFDSQTCKCLSLSTPTSSVLTPWVDEDVQCGVPGAAVSAQQEKLWTSESEHIPLKSIQNKIQNLMWLRRSRGTHWSTGSRLGLLCLDPYEVPGIDVTSLLLWSPLGTLSTTPTSSCHLPPHRLLATMLALLAQPSSGGAWTPWPQHVHVTSHISGPRHSNLFTWAWGPQQSGQHEPVCAEQGMVLGGGCISYDQN